MYYEQYVSGLGGREEVLEWAKTTLAAKLKKVALDQTEVEHILDYLMSDAAPLRLRRMSYDQAKAKADAWTKTQQKKGAHIQEQPNDVETIHQFADGSRIVKLVDERAFKREGFLMSHCVGSYVNSNSTIYSYRDKKNFPHATFEVESSGDSIIQIKGKGNGAIHPKYIDPILVFLKSLKISIRSSEMRNLGYHHVDDEMAQFIEQVVEPKSVPEYHHLYGERYIFVGAA